MPEMTLPDPDVVILFAITAAVTSAVSVTMSQVLIHPFLKVLGEIMPTQGIKVKLPEFLFKR